MEPRCPRSGVSLPSSVSSPKALRSPSLLLASWVGFGLGLAVFSCDSDTSPGTETAPSDDDASTRALGGQGGSGTSQEMGPDVGGSSENRGAPEEEDHGDEHPTGGGAGREENDSCSYALKLRSDKTTQIQVGSSCVELPEAWDLDDEVVHGACTDTLLQRFFFDMLDDCSFVMRFDASSEFGPRQCLSSEGSQVYVGRCDLSSARWTLEEIDAEFVIRSGEDCLTLTDRGPLATPCKETEATQRFALAGLAVAEEVTIEGATPTPPSISGHTGGNIFPANPIDLVGAGVASKDDDLIDTRSDFAAEYDVEFANGGQYVMSAKAASGFPQGAIGVEFDGTHRGNIHLDLTDNLSTMNRSRGLLLDVEAGTYRVRVTNAGNTPFSVRKVTFWPPKGELVSLDQVTSLAETGTTSIAIGAISDMWRVYYDTDTQWRCNKTTCYVEYAVDSPVDATYDLSLKLSPLPDGEGGVQILHDGQLVGGIPFGASATEWSEPVAIEMHRGKNRVRLDNGAYYFDIDGMSTGFTIHELKFDRK